MMRRTVRPVKRTLLLAINAEVLGWRKSDAGNHIPCERCVRIEPIRAL
jgi:hypothetical protein